jgi:hypothetical protein
MGHYGRFGEYGFGGPWWTNWWVLVGLGLATLVLLFIAWNLLKRRGGEHEHVGVDSEIYENMDGQIRSMLVQAGDTLSQDTIGNNLGVPVADLARTLHAMEERGEIHRVWIPSDYTYWVQLAPASHPQAPKVNGPSTQPSL